MRCASRIVSPVWILYRLAGIDFASNAVLKEHSYPLSQVSVPIGYNESVTDLNKVEKNEYTWKYSREKLETLVNEIKAARNIVTIE